VTPANEPYVDRAVIDDRPFVRINANRGDVQVLDYHGLVWVGVAPNGKRRYEVGLTTDQAETLIEALRRVVDAR
jgi:hypothetical protein